jgi:hypothetical protein
MMYFHEQFPIDIGERPLRFDSTQTNPVHLVRDQLQGIYQRHRHEKDQLLACLAQTRFQVQQALREFQAGTNDASAAAFETIVDILQDVLDQNQVSLNDRTGERWTAELLNEIDVRAHEIRADIAESRIIQMDLPVVRRQGRLIAKGSALVAAPQRD